MLRGIAQAAKAIYATVVAGLGALVTVLVGDVGIGDVTDGQWAFIAFTALVAGGGVYGIRNAEPS